MRSLFDDHPRFYETSETATVPKRLALRHEAMIECNRDILDGARVLDLASHDGRWSFAALQAGAAHVTGVEARSELVDNASKTFAEYGVPTDRYRFVKGDMFEAFARQPLTADVVLCLGFMYHTLRYPDLFRGIKDSGAQYLVLDTKVVRSDEPVVRLLVNDTKVQANAADDEFGHGGKVVAGWPSVPALRMLLDVYDFDVEKQHDWSDMLARRPRLARALRDYRRGERVTLRCRARARVDAAQPLP